MGEPSEDLRALKEMGNDAIPELQRELVAQPIGYRLKAAWILGQMGAPGTNVASGLVQAIEDPDPMVEAHALRALTRLGIARTNLVPELLVKLGDSHPSVSESAMELLLKIEQEAKVLNPSLISNTNEYVRVFLKSPSRRVQLAGLQKLSDLFGNDERVVALRNALLAGDTNQVQKQINTIFHTKNPSGASPAGIAGENLKIEHDSATQFGAQDNHLQKLKPSLVWDSESQSANALPGASSANFVFNFTNISDQDVIIRKVQTSCGCTTAKLAPLPWQITPGMNGHIDVAVDLRGKSGSIRKSVEVATDKDTRTLFVNISIQEIAGLPATAVVIPVAHTNEAESSQLVMPALTKEQREKNLKMAGADRQAVFQGDCAVCHSAPAQAKYGRELYQIACGICHETANRASMVPDLHALKVPTDWNFWRIWISQGKPGSLMPAFARENGGPLTEIQITTLADYLSASIPTQKGFQ